MATVRMTEKEAINRGIIAAPNKPEAKAPPTPIQPYVGVPTHQLVVGGSRQLRSALIFILGWMMGFAMSILFVHH